MRRGSLFSCFLQPCCRGFQFPGLLPVFRFLATKAQTATSAAHRRRHHRRESHRRRLPLGPWQIPRQVPRQRS